MGPLGQVDGGLTKIRKGAQGAPAPLAADPPGRENSPSGGGVLPGNPGRGSGSALDIVKEAAVPRIDAFLAQLVERKGSDLLMASGSPPIVRIYGSLVPLDSPALSAEEMKDLAWEILSVDDKERLPKDKNLDFAYQMKDPNHPNQRFRCNAYYQKNGLNVAMRAIPSQMPTLEGLNLPANLARLTQYHQGMVLITGPAGCGKTATLAALVNIINLSKPLHIITVEDPIEYIYPRGVAHVNQRQVGLHVDEFATALRAALREDPDVIVVGELRDLETISLAITAAETGHLVFGTLHTNSASKTVDRLIDAFPVDQQSQIRTMVSESLRGIVSQQLIPRKDGQGRVVVYEVLFVPAAVANMIREGKTHQLSSTMQTGKSRGMVMMDACLMDRFKADLITYEEALDMANDKKTFAQDAGMAPPAEL